MSSQEAQKPNKVKFSTFVDDLYSNQIEKVDLYTYGTIDITYTTKGGEFRSADLPHSSSENDLLIRSLKQHSVEYVAHDSSYPNDDSDTHYSSFLWTGSLFFIFPLLLILIIIFQARTISNLGRKLAEIAQGKVDSRQNKAQ